MCIRRPNDVCILLYTVPRTVPGAELPTTASCILIPACHSAGRLKCVEPCLTSFYYSFQILWGGDTGMGLFKNRHELNLRPSFSLYLFVCVTHGLWRLSPTEVTLHRRAQLWTPAWVCGSCRLPTPLAVTLAILCPTCWHSFMAFKRAGLTDTGKLRSRGRSGREAMPQASTDSVCHSAALHKFFPGLTTDQLSRAGH